MSERKNRLYYGDNISIMRKMGKHSVDLIYLDPPFNSKKNYNIMYKNMTGLPVSEQVEAFCDTWEMDAEKEEVARTMPVLMREYGVEDYYVEFWRLWIQALRHTQPHLLAYLIYMVERLLHMKSILRPHGSIYLHCDPTASHYIKVMMDGIFGHKNFRNEIIWKRTSGHNDARGYGSVHDTILFYSQSDKFIWNEQYIKHSDEYILRFRNKDKDGRLWTDDNLSAKGLSGGGYEYEYKGVKSLWRCPLETMKKYDSEGRLHFTSKGGIRIKRYLDEAKGVPLQDVWTDISPINSQAKERLGYPTQKPITLLDRIIKASSNEGDIIFDPFCGCGTTIYSAIRNNRKWIGCDIAILPIKLIGRVLLEQHGLLEDKNYEIDGVPVSIEQAEELFKKDPFQFEHWFVEFVGGFPTKKTGDHGIDGRMYFETKQGLKDMVLSVKGGNLRPTDVRDLRGVLEREEKEGGSVKLAGFLSLKEPSKAMREEAAKAGVYEYGNVKYSRIQFLTVKEALEDKKMFHTPTKVGIKGSTGGQLSLTLQ